MSVGHLKADQSVSFMPKSNAIQDKNINIGTTDFTFRKYFLKAMQKMESFIFRVDPSRDSLTLIQLSNEYKDFPTRSWYQA